MIATNVGLLICSSRATSTARGDRARHDVIGVLWLLLDRLLLGRGAQDHRALGMVQRA